MAERVAAAELPLFLLYTVLFPRMLLPLRVFEPRYRQLLDYCLERERTFGVLLIKSGREVGGPAEPFLVGTTAHIEEVQQQPDGTLAVTTVGVRRFRLVEMVQAEPFPLGVVELLDQDANGPPQPSLVAEVGQIAQRCLQLLLALNGEWVRRIDLPQDGEALSYLVAARLPVDLPQKQELLEAPHTGARLRLEVPLLQAVQQRLSQAVLERMWLQSARLN